jgi:hypothetical protein
MKPASHSTKRLISEVQLCAWLGGAVPGDVVEYHRGVLALDMAPYAGRLSEPDRNELKRVARRAAWAWAQGRVHLVQKRHGPDDYSYLIIARKCAGAIPGIAKLGTPSSLQVAS